MSKHINLLSYLPTFMQDYLEIQHLTAAENPEFERVWDTQDETKNDLFILTATEKGVSRWESILKIIPRATEALDARRFRVLTRLNEQLPYTVRTLSQQLSSLCGEDGYTVELQNDIYTLDVKVALVAKSNFEDVRALLRRVTPANIVITLTLKYNKHSVLHSFTYGALRQYTYKGIRDEVIKNGN